jgi:hypothetical protein
MANGPIVLVLIFGFGVFFCWLREEHDGKRWCFDADDHNVSRISIDEGEKERR